MELLVGAVAVAVVALVAYRLGRASGRPADAPIAPALDDASEGPVDTAPSGPSDSEGIERPDIERALADLRLGVVLVDADHQEVYRNNRAKEYATGRHGDALVEAALQRVIGAALVGLSLEESVEVYGPPARSFLVQASPASTADRPTGAVGVIEDVTEARHTLRVRSDFVANVSHELRTPVGAMSVLAETIADADDPDVVDRLSKRMQREATRLTDTIDDLLALSRLESGPITDPETVDLMAVAGLAIERCSEAAAQRQVEITIDETSTGPTLVEGDQGQLGSAVVNLVDNAVKYSDPAGTVEVRIGRVSGPAASVGAGGPESYSAGIGPHRPAPDREGRWRNEPMVAELSVFDDGIGIPERDLERIFERFYRVDSGRSRDTGGTGLGLSIVRHAVLNHRGTVDVDSLEGQGTAFTLRLPLAPAGRELAGNGGQPPVTRADGEATT